MVLSENQKFDYKLIKPHRKRLKMTQDDLADWMGVTRYSIINYEGGKTIPPNSINKLRLFLEAETKDELYDTHFDSFGNEYSNLPTGEYLINVPYIPISSYSQYISTFEFGELKLGHIVSDIDSGLYVAFQVENEAMDDGSRKSLTKGDIAIAKEIDKDKINVDDCCSDVWVIIIENNILFREVEQFIEGENCVIFKALNPSLNDSDFRIELSSIKKIYQVIKRITNF